MKKRILVVEDSKLYQNFILDCIEKGGKFEAVVVSSYKEVQRAIKENNDFFIAIVDIVLEDGIEGEAIDYLINKNISVIVLTSLIDDTIQELIQTKAIVDYIVKETSVDIEYAVLLAERTLYYNQLNVLVVDDSTIYRKQIESYLNDLKFNVTVAKSGEEAIEIIKNNDFIFKLIIIDYHMEGLNGLELSREIRSKNEDVIIIATTGKHSIELEYKFMKVGSDDYLKKPFTKEEFNIRIVNNMRRLEQLEELKKYTKKCEQLSITDGLTGIYNRKFMDTQLTHEIKRANRYKNDFCLILMDIDHFKEINDKHGHLFGDKVLIRCVSTLSQNIRSSDFLGRWGGEEFLILCPNLTLEDSFKVAEKLRSEISQINFHTDFQVTSSFGVAQYIDSDNSDQLINRVDKALYLAKDNGRNRVEKSED